MTQPTAPGVSNAVTRSLDAVGLPADAGEIAELVPAYEAVRALVAELYTPPAQELME